MDGRLVEKAVKSLEERGIRVCLADSGAGALEMIGEIIRSGPVALSNDEYIAGLGLCQMLRAGKIEAFVAGGDTVPRDPAGGESESLSKADRRDRLARALEGAAWGVTGAAAIAADTGSILIMEEGGCSHLVSALPPAHLVVAGAGCITPTLGEALSRCRQLSRRSLNRPLAGRISIISGPSMTADIQGVPVKGMHGPLEVHLVLVREEGKEAGAAV
ncbi:MAG: lactate utilization protein [Peptococcaceae bacterium]|nr:lactate utilization protein [Peptococcaceae bacterium]